MTTERIRSKFGSNSRTNQADLLSRNPISSNDIIDITFRGRIAFVKLRNGGILRTAGQSKTKVEKNKISSQERRCRGMPTRMRSLLVIPVGLALLSGHMCQAQGNQLPEQENRTHDAQQHVHNQGIRRNGMLGSTRGRHYTRGRRLRGAAAAVVDTAVTDIPDRHFVLTADKRQSSWREARRMASHMM